MVIGPRFVNVRVPNDPVVVVIWSPVLDEVDILCTACLCSLSLKSRKDVGGLVITAEHYGGERHSTHLNYPERARSYCGRGASRNQG